MDPIIPAGFDPFAERTYTLTLTTAETFAICDAVTCLHHIATGGDPELYRDYHQDGGFMSDAHAVADRIHDLTRADTRAVGQYFKNLSDSLERRN